MQRIVSQNVKEENGGRRGSPARHLLEPGWANVVLKYLIALRRGVHILLRKILGESVNDVRTASEEAWGVFLRAFTRWCASEEGHELVKHLPARSSLAN